MKFITIFLLLITLAFSSCQKELSTEFGTTPVDTTVTPPATVNKLKTYSEDATLGGVHSAITFNIAYDASDRVISLISTTSPGDKFIYQYNSNTSLTMDLYNSNVLSIHEMFFLNNSGLLDSTFQYNDTNDSTTEKYFYNSAKQLVQLKDYDYSISTGAVLYSTDKYAYDSNGNLVTDTGDFSVTTYDYYNIANNLLVFPFLSINPVNLVKTETNTSGGVTDVLNHTYTFDSINRVIKDKIEVAGSSDVVIKTYTYY